MNGSTFIVLRSGIIFISLASMVCQHRILEPSNITPSSRVLSLTTPIGTCKCCQVPSKSMNLKSTNSMSFFLIESRISLGVVISNIPLCKRGISARIKGRLETKTRQLKSKFVSKNLLPLPKASQVLLFKLTTGDKSYTKFMLLI